MRMLCEEHAFGDWIQRMVHLTEQHGWGAVGVQGSTSWAYTIGLTWRHEHPELIVVGGSPEIISGILHRAVDRIGDGERFTHGSVMDADGGSGSLRFGRVHERNLLGEWMGAWPAVARASGHGSTGLRALQVIVRCNGACQACDAQILLDRRCTPDDAATVRRPASMSGAVPQGRRKHPQRRPRVHRHRRDGTARSRSAVLVRAGEPPGGRCHHLVLHALLACRYCRPTDFPRSLETRREVMGRRMEQTARGGSAA